MILLSARWFEDEYISAHGKCSAGIVVIFCYANMYIVGLLFCAMNMKLLQLQRIIDYFHERNRGDVKWESSLS